MGFIERPLVLGFFWWACTGDFAPAMPLAIFFELFWLDLFPIGSYIPPMPAFPFLAVLSLSASFGWADASSFALPLVLSLPLAYIVPYVEGRQRNLQKTASSKLLTQARKVRPLGALPGTLLAVSALQHLLLGLAAFCLVTCSLYLFLSLPAVNHILLRPLNVGWPFLYAVAAIGALLALRIRRAYLLFGFFMSAALFVRIFLR